MSHLNKEIAEIVVINIPCHARALSLPIEPGAEGTVMDVVIFDYYVNSRVKLDAADLVGKKLVLCGYVVDFIVLDL